MALALLLATGFAGRVDGSDGADGDAAKVRMGPIRRAAKGKTTKRKMDKRRTDKLKRDNLKMDKVQFVFRRGEISFLVFMVWRSLLSKKEVDADEPNIIPEEGFIRRILVLGEIIIHIVAILVLFRPIGSNIKTEGGVLVDIP